MYKRTLQTPMIPQPADSVTFYSHVSSPFSWLGSIFTEEQYEAQADHGYVYSRSPEGKPQSWQILMTEKLAAHLGGVPRHARGATVPLVTIINSNVVVYFNNGAERGYIVTQVYEFTFADMGSYLELLYINK